MIGLAGAISILVGAQVFDRRLRPAVASVDEGLQLARQFGYENDETGLLALRARIAALQGREHDCREDAAEAIRRSLANGIGWATLNSRLALAELELGLGNPAEALAHLDQMERSVVPPVSMMAIPDLVDAALRVGERDRAARPSSPSGRGLRWPARPWSTRPWRAPGPKSPTRATPRACLPRRSSSTGSTRPPLSERGPSSHSASGCDANAARPTPARTFATQRTPSRGWGHRCGPSAPAAS